MATSLVEMFASALPFVNKGKMPNAADFNDYKTPGTWYHGGTNAGAINPPHSADNGYLVVAAIPGSSVIRILQIWLSVYQGILKYRTYNGTEWLPWETIGGGT